MSYKQNPCFKNGGIRYLKYIIFEAISHVTSPLTKQLKKGSLYDYPSATLFMLPKTGLKDASKPSPHMEKQDKTIRP